MIKFLQSMLGDGEGNISTTRVITALIILVVLATKIYNAWITKTPVVWDGQDLTLIGAALGTKLIQNTQETTASQLPAPPK